jgi:hypothetical protein
LYNCVENAETFWFVYARVEIIFKVAVVEWNSNAVKSLSSEELGV